PLRLFVYLVQKLRRSRAPHPEHVRKILKRRLGGTSQKPRRQARERDDEQVASSPASSGRPSRYPMTWPTWPPAETAPWLCSQCHRGAPHLSGVDLVIPASCYPRGTRGARSVRT